MVNMHRGGSRGSTRGLQIPGREARRKFRNHLAVFLKVSCVSLTYILVMQMWIRLLNTKKYFPNHFSPGAQRVQEGLETL